MALQVWLPLNGNLENKGLKNISIVNSGATINESGKIGSCYSFTNSKIICDNPNIPGSTISASAWIYLTNISSLQYIISLNNSGGWADQSIGISVEEDDIYFCAGSSYCSSSNIQTNKWFHAAVTYDGGKIRGYIDGIEVASINASSPINRNFLTIGARYNGSSYAYLLDNAKLNDIRIYDHALSQREVKELSQALMLHYKLDINDIQSIGNVNLVANGYGGTDNWAYKSSSYVMTDVPTDESLITNSYGNTNYTLEYIPILQDHTYQASAWVKKTGSNYCYVAWIPYDIDHNQIQHYMTPSGFSGKRTTLSQDLKPGDTLVHLTSVSGWTNFGSVESLLAFFGYADSTGYVYPDYIYTRRCYSFDKTSVDTTNKTVTLTSAYSGETIKAGTAVCTSSYGATYYYSSSLSGSTTEWTKATANFTPKNVNYLKAARYLRFTCMSSAYNHNAGISLKDITYNNLKFYTYLQCDTSSYIKSGVIPTTSTNFEMKYAANSLSSENVYFGCSTASGYVNGNNYSLDVLTSGSLFYSFRNQGYDSSNITTTTNTPFIVKLQGDTFSINGNSMSANRHTSHPNLEIYLFACNVNGTVGNSNIKAAKLYYCKFWEGDTLIRDFVPCSYNGVYGLWDLCENKFYGNAGSGAFTVSEERPSPQNRIYDLSGYNRHAMLVSSNIEADTAVSRYDNCIKNLDSYPLKSVFDFPQSNGLTIACWIYLTAWGAQGSGLWSTSTSYTNNPSDYTATTCNHCDGKFYLRGTNGSSYNITCGTGVISSNTWNHVVLTHDGENIKVYVNSILKYTQPCLTPLVGFKSLFLGYSNAGSLSRQCKGKWSDFRMYATALSADDIADLYHTSAMVDNLGSFHTFELNENEKNILFEENCGIAKKQFIRGLSYYTQPDCQCTLTDDGYRIYRTPNKTYDGTSATRTMYGGLRIVNTNNRFNLIKGHSYLFQFDVKGQSTTAASLLWTNNLGWGGGGLSPTPTTLYVKNLPANFISDDYVTVSWAFNIPDSIYKTCTSSYSSFVAGTDYVSYRDLGFSYNYVSTGELGTDLYIKNIRLIDITNGEHMNVFKDGITDMMHFIEFGNPSKIQKGGVSYANEFIEI